MFSFVHRITVCLEDPVESVQQSAKDTLVYLLQ